MKLKNIIQIGATFLPMVAGAMEVPETDSQLLEVQLASVPFDISLEACLERSPEKLNGNLKHDIELISKLPDYPEIEKRDALLWLAHFIVG